MKKSVFYYLFAVICTVCLFTACSDDDDDDNKVLTVDNIVGTYPGDLDVTLAGTEVAKDVCLLYTSPSPRDLSTSRMPSSA